MVGQKTLEMLEEAEIFGASPVNHSLRGCDNICDDFCNDCTDGYAYLAPKKEEKLYIQN